jgi:hypothetical protein
MQGVMATMSWGGQQGSWQKMSKNWKKSKIQQSTSSKQSKQQQQCNKTHPGGAQCNVTQLEHDSKQCNAVETNTKQHDGAQ